MSKRSPCQPSGLIQALLQFKTYAYDDLNRIQSATETISGNQTWKQTFIIDRYGNRRFDAANTTTLGTCQQAICNPTISTANNRFSSDQGYDYDQNGNVTQDAEGKTFLYDAENHQKEVKDASNNTIGLYLYDGEGRRIKKISNVETVIFVYNASGQLVAEYSTALAQTQQVSYLTTDHLGSPRVITNENGAVTSRKDFSAFGEETLTPQRTEGLGYVPPNIRQDYTGYQKDDESGLDFAQARYYNSTHGRYTSIDPLTASASIRNPQTFNRCSYVLNSPYKFTDPLGLLPQPRGWWHNVCGAEFSSCSDGFDSEWEPAEAVPESHTNEVAEPPLSSQDTPWYLKNPYFSRDSDPELQETDDALAEIFTDTGMVLGASSVLIEGSDFNHHKFREDGKVHTLHIYGNKTATADAGVYIPKEFNQVQITSKDTVVARNPVTGDVLLIAHVQVGTADKGSITNKALRENMKTVRENGTMFIGNIGGKGGEGVKEQANRGRHAHLSYFPSERSRVDAYNYKKNQGKLGDYTPAITKHLSDFRKLLK